MKFSTAILKGYKKIDGRQCVDFYAVDSRGNNSPAIEDVYACCVMGAANLALSGDPHHSDLDFRWREKFEDAWGIDPASLNNNREFCDLEPFPWEHIYGMAVAAGL